MQQKNPRNGTIENYQDNVPQIDADKNGLRFSEGNPRTGSTTKDHDMFLKCRGKKALHLLPDKP
jgi:hypothetical protein